MIGRSPRQRAVNSRGTIRRPVVADHNAPPLQARLSALEARLEAALSTLTQAQTESTQTLAAAMAKIEGLERQLARSGKEQFKANTLAEAQQKGAEAALEQLREGATSRERELALLREQAAQAGLEGRMEVIRRLLPALDGLEEALASGQRLLSAASAAPSATPSFWQRLNPARRSAPATAITLSAETQALAAWLEGLTFVRDRLLATLAATNVLPIPTVGHPFDPHRHVAVEAVEIQAVEIQAGKVQAEVQEATEPIAPDTILREQRRGYMRGDTVLRYAEVVVARAPRENLS